MKCVKMDLRKKSAKSIGAIPASVLIRTPRIKSQVLLRGGMEFPGIWDVFPMDDYLTAGPRNAGQLGMELLAQVRPNGRVLDHYRITLGGSRILDVDVSLASLLLVPRASPWKLKFQTWPRDVAIRRNMSTSLWMDVVSTVAARSATVVDADGQPVPYEAALQVLEERGKQAAVRFAVVIGEDSRMQLQLHGLPASADTLSGKPTFRG